MSGPDTEGATMTESSDQTEQQPPTEVGDDGLLYINTGEKIDGSEPGSLQIDEPATGPPCASEGHG